MTNHARIVVAFAGLTGLAACSTMPLPEDQTKLDTVGIVQKVRCEAREPLKAKFATQFNRIKAQLDQRAMQLPKKQDEALKALNAVLNNPNSSAKEKREARQAYNAKKKDLDRRVVRNNNRLNFINGVNIGGLDYAKFFADSFVVWENEVITDTVNDAVSGGKPPNPKAKYESPFRKLALTNIIYEYEFFITEGNKLEANANTELGLTSTRDAAGVITGKDHSLTTNLNASANQDRSNKRTFVINDNARKLLSADLGKQCTDLTKGGDLPDGVELSYPIEGEVGLANTVDTFFKLRDMGILAAGANQAGRPTLTDEVTFTTTISAGVTPKVTISVGPISFGLTDATFGVAASRKDIHKLRVVMNEPKDSEISAAIAGGADGAWCRRDGNAKFCNHGAPERVDKVVKVANLPGRLAGGAPATASRTKRTGAGDPERGSSSTTTAPTTADQFNELELRLLNDATNESD